MIPTTNTALMRAITTDRIKKPIMRVRMYDSPYGVPSNGMQMRVYNDASGSASFVNENTLVFVGADPILSHDWDDGAPPGLSQVDRFSAKWYGYFYAEYTGSYKFITNSAGSARMYIAGDSDRNFHPSGLQVSHLLSMSLIANTTGPVDSWDYHQRPRSYHGNISMTAGRWYPIRVEYQNLVGKAAMSVQYVEPLNTSTSVTNMWGETTTRNSDPQKKILSAGICNYSTASGWNTATDNMVGFTNPVTLPDIHEIEGSKKLDQAAQYVITVPLKNIGEGSYVYDFDLENYFHEGIRSYIRRGRLVEISMGYQTSCSQFQTGNPPTCLKNHHPAGSYPNSDWFIPTRCQNLGNELCPDTTPNSTDYIVRFRGIISNFNTKREKRNTTLEIVCHDHSIFLSESINENWPNNISYANAGPLISGWFVSNFIGRYAGYGNPDGRLINQRTIIAYDAWPVVDAVHDIMTKAGIDPVLQYGKSKVLGYNGSIQYAGSLIEDKSLILTRKNKYGIGNLFVNSSDNTDDKYLWGFDFGEKPIDMINKIADTYGFKTGFDNEGHAIFATKNNFKTIDSSDTSWTGSPTSFTDINATQGHYFKPNPTSNITVSGSKFEIVTVLVSGLNLSRWDLIQNEVYNHINPNDTTYEITKPAIPGVTRNWNSHSVLWGIQGGIVSQPGDKQATPTDTYIASGYQSIFIFRPTNTFLLSGFRFSASNDFISFPPWSSFLKDKINVNFYIGTKSSSNDSSFTAVYGNGYNIISNYKPYSAKGPRNLREYNIDLVSDANTKFVISGGYTYALKVVTDDVSITGLQYLPDIYTRLKQVTILTNPNNETKKWGYFDPSNGLWSIDDNQGDGIIFSKMITPAVTLVGSGDSNASIIVKKTGGAVVYTKSFSGTLLADTMDAGKTLRFVYDGINLRTGDNPCIIPIKASDLVLPNSDGIRYPYGSYDIYVSGTGMYLDEVRAYDLDIEEPVFSFATGGPASNIKTLNIDDASDDIRNDVLVVGNQLGPISDTRSGNVMNPNNPASRYIFSRVVDIDSVYRLESIYNIGRRKPFIIFEPNIIRQDHADALAISVAQRYRFGKKSPSFSTIGIPTIEVGDPITIEETRFKSLGRFGSNQWVSSYTEHIKPRSYESNIDTAPFLPWPSVQTKPAPDPNNFNGNTFVNISLTDDNGDPRVSGFSGSTNKSYDPYESEGSSARVNTGSKARLLKISFDQVIAGDVRIFIIPASKATQPYWAQGFDFNGSELSAVAFLRPDATGHDNPDFYSQDWGHYELYWDGVDYTGWSHYSRDLRVNDNILVEANPKNIYVHDGRYVVVFQYRPLGSIDISQTISSEHLIKQYNNPSTAPTSASSYYAAYFDVQKGPVTYVDFQVSPDPVGNFTNAIKDPDGRVPYNANNYSNYIEFSSFDNNNRGLKIAIKSNDSTGSSINRLLAMRMTVSFWHWGMFNNQLAPWDSTDQGKSYFDGLSTNSEKRIFEINGDKYKVIENLTYRSGKDLEIFFDPKNPEYSPLFFSVPTPWNQLGLPSSMNPINSHSYGQNISKTWLETFNASATSDGATCVAQGFLINFDIWDRSGRILGSTAGSDITYRPGNTNTIEGGTNTSDPRLNYQSFVLRTYYSPIGLSRSPLGESGLITSGEYIVVFSQYSLFDGAPPNTPDPNSYTYNAMGHMFWKAYAIIKSNAGYAANFPTSPYPPWGHPYSNSDTNPDDWSIRNIYVPDIPIERRPLGRWY